MPLYMSEMQSCFRKGNAISKIYCIQSLELLAEKYSKNKNGSVYFADFSELLSTLALINVS